MEFLPVLWFILIAVLWIGYLCLEGFDFGVGMLMPILGKSDKDKRVMLNTIGPHWDGNEVWLLTAGGATFAAFPQWYATMFSGMYLALVVILLFLIVRICAIEWRGKIDDPAWRKNWDQGHTVAAWGTSLLWGVAFANLVQGMKIEVVTLTDPARRVYETVDPSQIPADGALPPEFTHQLVGGFFSLLTPFTILGGLVTLSLFLTHGAIFTALKTTGDLQARSEKLAAKLSMISLGVTAVWAIIAWVFYANKWAGIPLLLAALALAATTLFALKGDELKAFIANFVAIAFAVVFIFVAIFPNVMKSSIDDAYSLTISQAAAAHHTLVIMTGAAVVFVPIVLGYTIWSYKVFARRISNEELPDKPAGLPLSFAK